VTTKNLDHDKLEGSTIIRLRSYRVASTETAWTVFEWGGYVQDWWWDGGVKVRVSLFFDACRFPGGGFSRPKTSEFTGAPGYPAVPLV